MILVQSLLLQLNGNRLTFICFLSIFCSSCGLFRDISYSSQYESIPQSDIIEDTIVQEVVVSHTDVKSTTDTVQRSIRGDKVDTFSVALVLPLESNAMQLSDANSFVLSFYEGSKRGFEDLNTQEKSLLVNVYDSNDSKTSIHSILNQLERNKTNLILGGLMKDHIVELSNFALDHKIPYVCPIYPTNELIKNNAFHIQATAGFQAHCKKMISYIQELYPSHELYFISRDIPAERQRIQSMIGLFDTSLPLADELIIHEVYLDWEDENSSFDFIGDFKPYSQNVVIVPSWSSETFIYSILRQLSIDKRTADIKVFGMPQWKSFDLIGPEYYEELSLHISAGSFIESNDKKRIIQKRLYDILRNIPTEKEVLAYAVGYDIASYFGKLLLNYGPEFISYMSEEYYEGIALNMAFNLSDQQEVLSDQIPIEFQRLENQGVKLLHFDEWSFKTKK